jgi:type IX secretion system PorP/SprF family membrane protein
MRHWWVSLFVFHFFSGKAQDVAFSHIHAMPLHLNPAMTGFFDGDVRVAAIYRNQWFTIHSPYGNTMIQTAGASVDGSFLKGKYQRNYMGAGLCVYNDWAGDLSFRTTDATLNIAYSQGFGKGDVRHSLALGLQGQFRTYGIQSGKAVFSDRIPENITANVLNFDAGVGLRYHVAFRTRLSWYIGGAYTHILQPNERFVSVGSRTKSKITVHSGAVMDVTPRFNVLPSVMFLYQGGVWQLNGGTYLQYIFDAFSDERNGISFGLFSRFAQPLPDAIIASLRLDYKGFQAVMGYDFNISQWSKATNGQGAIEAGVSYIVQLQKNKRSKVPCIKF